MARQPSILDCTTSCKSAIVYRYVVNLGVAGSRIGVRRGDLNNPMMRCSGETAFCMNGRRPHRSDIRLAVTPIWGKTVKMRHF
jgi:hypothetical protein